MSIGIAQLILIIIIGILLFGNLPKIIKDISISIATFKKTILKQNIPSSEKSKICHSSSVSAEEEPQKQEMEKKV